MVNSLYDGTISIGDANHRGTGAFTLMVTTGMKVGGHAMMAFEWLDKNSVHRHDVYHLHTDHSGDSSGGSSNLISGKAIIHKVVRGARDDGRQFNKQIGVHGRRGAPVDEVYHSLKKNYMEDVPAGSNRFIRKNGLAEGIDPNRTFTINLSKQDIKYGIYACRLIILGENVDNIHQKKISVLFGQLGLNATNCINFTRDISKLMGLQWNSSTNFKALFSSAKAIKSAGFRLNAVEAGSAIGKRRTKLLKQWTSMKRTFSGNHNLPPGLMGDDFTDQHGHRSMELISGGAADDKDAGHGHQSKVMLRVGGNILPNVFRKKPCTGVEAYTYARLTRSKLSQFLPQLVAVIADGTTHFFYGEKKNRSFFSTMFPMSRKSKLAREQCHIVIEDVSYTLSTAWSCTPKDIEVIDIKIGSAIYLDDELRLNGHKKHRITKKVQDFTVFVSKVGGAQGMMVAKKKGLKRALGYSASKKRVAQFFSGLDKNSRQLALKQLSTFYTYMFDDGELENNVSFVGASLFFLKQKNYKDRFMMTFIDLDHAVFKDRAEDAGYDTLFWEANGNFMTGLGNLMQTIAAIK